MRLPLGKRIKAWLTNHLQITIPSPSPFERLMDEAAPVFCRLLAPDGRPVRKRVSVTIHFGRRCGGGDVSPGLRGRCCLPAVLSAESAGENYFCYITGEEGYFVTREWNLIRKGAVLRLSQGGRIEARWRGQGEKPEIVSLDSGMAPESSLRIVVDREDGAPETEQFPPGPFILHALFPASSEPGTAVAHYVKWGEIRSGETVTMDVGKGLKVYEIACLLPESLPDDVKLTLSLSCDLNSITYMCLAGRQIGQAEIAARAAAGFEGWSFSGWPLKEGRFRFLAREDRAKVEIMRQCGERADCLQAVEFAVGEPRVRTVDLRDHELLKPMR